MPEPITIDIYCRITELELPDRSKLEEQEQLCRGYCAGRGLTVGMVGHDSLPGTKLHERMALNRMRRRYLDGTIQGVVVTNIDRLSRSYVRQAILVSEMERHNIILHVVEEHLEETLQGKFLLALSTFLTEVEREKTLASQKD